MVPDAFALASMGPLHLPPFLSQLSPTHVLETAMAPPWLSSMVLFLPPQLPPPTFMWAGTYDT